MQHEGLENQPPQWRSPARSDYQERNSEIGYASPMCARPSPRRLKDTPATAFESTQLPAARPFAQRAVAQQSSKDMARAVMGHYRRAAEALTFAEASLWQDAIECSTGLSKELHARVEGHLEAFSAARKARTVFTGWRSQTFPARRSECEWGWRAVGSNERELDTLKSQLRAAIETSDMWRTLATKTPSEKAAFSALTAPYEGPGAGVSCVAASPSPEGKALCRSPQRSEAFPSPLGKDAGIDTQPFCEAIRRMDAAERASRREGILTAFQARGLPTALATGMSTWRDQRAPGAPVSGARGPQHQESGRLPATQRWSSSPAEHARFPLAGSTGRPALHEEVPVLGAHASPAEPGEAPGGWSHARGTTGHGMESRRQSSGWLSPRNLEELGVMV